MQIRMTIEEYNEHRTLYDGVCMACGAIRCGDTEPDAEDYPCEECGQEKVIGIESALMEDVVVIATDEPC